MEQFLESFKKAVEAVVEIVKKVVEIIKQFWAQVRPLLQRVLLYQAGYRIVNHRGRNKLARL